MISIKRALISVSDKNGIIEFAQGLTDSKVELIATGKTYELLKNKGIPVRQVSDVTEFPEILNGRVKTLHPRIFGGILARKDDPAHLESMKAHGIPPIDMVILNFYPFEDTVKNPSVSLEEAIEKIDVGGPSMLRAAAKNHRYVVPVSNPAHYPEVLKEIRNLGGVKEETSLRLAYEAFAGTMAYDAAIQKYLAAKVPDFTTFPPYLLFALHKKQDLRYGENPHQEGALYQWALRDSTEGIFSYDQVQGKELSFNNSYDLDGALKIPAVFSEPCVAIIKHANPCGVAVGNDIKNAYERALSCDPVSAFGGIIALNRPIDDTLAMLITERFYEVVAAPDFTVEALERLGSKKKMIVMKQPKSLKTGMNNLSNFTYKAIAGGMLVQQSSPAPVSPDQFRVVSRRQPTDTERKAMLFGWSVVQFVKSNAIVLARENQTIGIGAGQMSRVDSTKIAIEKARNAGHEVKGSAVASDAFFPFRDNVDLLAEAGVTAIIQPGGSIRDAEVIEAADTHGLTMWFTGYRQFLH